VQPLEAEYCLNDTILPLEVAVIDGVGTPSYQWYSNDTSDTLTPTPIGTNSNILNIPNTSVSLFYYYCIISYAEGGCSELTTQIIPITISQVPQVSNFQILICSGDSFSISPDSTNGNIIPLNTTYTWQTPVISPPGAVIGGVEQLNPVLTISQALENTSTNPATVTYQVTPLSENCSGPIFEVVVTVNLPISVISIPINNTCFESNNGAISTTISGGIPFGAGNPYIFNWTGPNNFESTNQNISNLESGIYTLDIEDQAGCLYSESFTIRQPEILAFTAIDFDPNTISCFGFNDGTIGVTVSGGTLPYNYNWVKDGVSFSNQEDVFNLGPGQYEVTVTDVNNCNPIIESFSIQDPPPLQISLITQIDVFCFGDATGAITVNVDGGRPNYSFVWLGPNGFTSTSQNIDTLGYGSYTLISTDSYGCAESSTFTIVQNDEITIDISATEIQCFGTANASITINSINGGVPPYDISWSNLGTGFIQNNLTAGTYIITITDAENCAKVFPVTINQAPLFSINPIVNQMSCSGENDASIILNFQGGMNPITLVWDDDPTAGVERNNLSPGTYSVTITDGTPCVIEDSFTISDILPLQLSANVTNALGCDDANSGAINLVIEGGTAPFDVLWSNGATTEDLSDISPNTYTVFITDANGCEIEGNWQLTRFRPLEVSVDKRSVVSCEAKTINQTFVALASGGVPPFYYNWSSGTVSGTTNEIMTTEQDGLVRLEVTDSLGCSISFDVNVTIPTLGDPDFDTSSFAYTNFGIFSIQDSIQFRNTSSGDYESILWNFGDGNFSSEESPAHVFIEVGNYTITKQVTYPFGCKYAKTITLTIEKGYKIIMPEAFTPNDDTFNDFFRPEYIGLNNLTLNIFDRWGSVIYSESSDNIRGWDGKINNQNVENGNYYYTLTASTFYEETIKKNGDFVIIK
jgi:gliding motility-associated-like protein